MLSVKNPEILSLVQDYRIHLIAPASLSDEEINKFSTNLREVLLFIKYSKNKEKLAELLTHDSRFKSIDRKAVRVMNTVANLKLNLNESEGDMDMCQAIDEMISDARTEGREQGRTEGTQETMVTLIKNLMNSMKITVDDAMTHLQIPVNERAELIAQVIKNK
jgi:predicted transposase YdaD